jgi:bla regulator protein blaR1
MNWKRHKLQNIAALSAAVVLLRALPIPAQNQDAVPRQAFEVVSVKPTQGQPVNSGFRRATGGVLNATNVSVRFLIEYAYDVRDDQISGGPAWLDSERYEVLAKPGGNSDPAGQSANLIRLRTQSLLADRFHLILHRDTKELPVLALTVAKNGPKGLRESTAGSPDFVNNGHHLNCQRVSMAMFAKEFLAHQTGRSVTDKTGIAGDFDFTLDWTPDDAAPGASADAATAIGQFPSFLTALQEQLGLRLEQQKGPVEILVIDHAERPAAN